MEDEYIPLSLAKADLRPPLFLFDGAGVSYVPYY